LRTVFNSIVEWYKTIITNGTCIRIRGSSICLERFSYIVKELNRTTGTAANMADSSWVASETNLEGCGLCELVPRKQNGAQIPSVEREMFRCLYWDSKSLSGPTISLAEQTSQFVSKCEEVFFLNPILFAFCISTFSKLCVTYTVTCRRVLSSAPLYPIGRAVSCGMQRSKFN
jgi:hypothetical protein